jgi:phage tail P2-like protein
MSEVKSLLPPNATPFERAAEQAISRLGDIPIDLPTTLWDPMNCPEDMLAYLAWGLSIDAWDPLWPLMVRRHRVATAIEIQRQKGTVKSVSDVVESFGGSMVLKEWWQYSPPRDPFTFDIIITVGGSFGAMPANYIDDIVAEVSRTKPVRAHFDVTQGFSADASIGFGAFARPLTYARITAAAA